MKKHAKVTSKGQITIPLEVRRALRVKTGDRVLFEGDERSMRIRRVKADSPFAKYSGIGNPGIPGSIEGINRWLRELRGHGDSD
ncbi:MAG TPA: AbrB/MazE/SpoVT family DNA-binding domain-containing protein [Terriglobales bacterium]|nr:AbrB/MazE/SpoVT family DNA-binding domain-containing protein [Terriglobales bacterium]